MMSKLFFLCSFLFSFVCVYSKAQFTIVKEFYKPTDFSHFTMGNRCVDCHESNRDRMKPKFTMVNHLQKAWFTVHFCLCS